VEIASVGTGARVATTGDGAATTGDGCVTLDCTGTEIGTSIDIGVPTT
jgi:hypothetical protein